MPTATTVTKETFQNTLRNIFQLPDEYFLKLAEYVEELIEEEEEAEDIAYIESLTPDDYANTIPLEEVIKEFEAEYGPLYQN